MRRTQVSDLVNKVAELLNAPVDLVKRSAEARAAASGVSVDDVLILGLVEKVLQQVQRQLQKRKLLLKRLQKRKLQLQKL